MLFTSYLTGLMSVILLAGQLPANVLLLVLDLYRSTSRPDVLLRELRGQRPDVLLRVGGGRQTLASGL